MFDLRNPPAVAVGHLHLLRFNNTRNGSVSTQYRLHLLHLSTATATARTEATRSIRSSSSQSSPISSVEYLVKSLRLPAESAHQITMAKGMKLKSTENAVSVLALFQDYGFTPSDMATIFSKCPKLLALDARRILKPKLDFFSQNGISGDALFHILTTDPFILYKSLDRIIIPCISFLNSFFGHDSQRVASQLCVKRGTWVLRQFSESVPANVQTLRGYGVPDSHILKFTIDGFGSLGSGEEEFSEAVREAKEMGFDPSNMIFIRAIHTILGMKKEKLEAKFELLKSFGWTDEQVRALFMRQPHFFKASHEKLKIALEFFMNKFNWTAYDVSNYPTALLCSFDKRILPRSSVLEILISKGLVKKTTVGKAIKETEDAFIRNFVNKYQDDFPQLLEIYQTRMACRD